MSPHAVVALDAIPHVLAPAAFVAHLDALARRADSLGAMLAIELRQTDRIGALVGAPHAQRLVQRIHQQLAELLQPGDRYCIVSADEVWIALGDVLQEPLASVTAHHVLRAIASAADASEGYTGLHPCIGIAIAPTHGRTGMQLIEAADLARRTAHFDDQAVVAFQPTHMASRADPLLLEELRDAIRSNLITVAYQPQIDLRSGRCTAVEALLRWTRSNGEKASPLAVAELAERTDLLYPLTELVLNTILRQLVGLHADGIRLRVGVNLSARLVGDHDLTELALQLLETWNVAPSQITLEITETALLSRSQRVEEMLATLHDHGLRVAMDDFGTGYSSLAQFRRFRFDEIKIDKVFVTHLLQDQGDRQIVRAMIDLAHGFGMEVVAEGVEDERTLGLLCEMGCDYAQGYFIGRPMTDVELRKWWRQISARGGAASHGELHQLGGESSELLV